MRCFPIDIFISFVFPRAVGLFVCFSRRCCLTATKGAILLQPEFIDSALTYLPPLGRRPWALRTAIWAARTAAWTPTDAIWAPADAICAPADAIWAPRTARRGAEGPIRYGRPAR